jgi:hypothetical protein
MRYGDEWRARRRAFHSVNLPEQVVSYQAGQMADMHLFLRDLLASPQKVSKLNQLCGSLALCIQTGTDVGDAAALRLSSCGSYTASSCSARTTR